MRQNSNHAVKGLFGTGGSSSSGRILTAIGLALAPSTAAEEWKEEEEERIGEAEEDERRITENCEARELSWHALKPLLWLWLLLLLLVSTRGVA